MTFSSVAEKTGRCREEFLAVGHTLALVVVAVVEGFKQDSMYGLSAGTEKVAGVERWPLVEARMPL